jgi:lysophospholipase L1-like esterase
MFLLLLYIAIRMIAGLLRSGQNVTENVLVFFIGLLLTETILSLTDWTKTQSEKLYDVYLPVKNEFNDFKKYYWIDDPLTVKTLRDKEFHFIRTINSNGYSDTEWTVAKKPNEFRILCLGDSFTEGDGAHADSSYVSFLRRKLQTGPCPITVMNAGKCGSDPFFNFVNYRDLLLQFNPNLIIQTVSRHDMTDDIVLRGGMERFGDDYSLSFQKKSGPIVEFFYAISYTGRIFFKALGYNELLINTKSFSLDLPEVETATADLFEEYADLADQNGAHILIVFLPNKFEVKTEYPDYFLSLMEDITKMKVSTCDLRSFYLDRTENIDSYYWIDNGHHNAHGYELMSEGILQSIETNGLLKLDSTCAEL